jgi:hypothetical protein
MGEYCKKYEGYYFHFLFGCFFVEQEFVRRLLLNQGTLIKYILQ